MGTNECSQQASKSSWDSQDFGDVNMVLKMAHFHKSSRPQWVNGRFKKNSWLRILMLLFILTFGKYNDQRHDDENGYRNGLMMGATINSFTQSSYN